MKVEHCTKRTFVINDSYFNEAIVSSMAMSKYGDKLAIGVYSENTSSRRVLIFNRIDNIWILEAKLVSPDSDGYDYFGISIAMSEDGDKIVIGAPSANMGVAYVYFNVDGLWSRNAILSANDVTGNDRFGSSVGISGDGFRIVIGAEQATIDGKSCAGAAYVFVETLLVWHNDFKLVAEIPIANDHFGQSVTISLNGYMVAIGSLCSVSIFHDNSYNGWHQEAKLAPVHQHGSPNTHFGRSIAISRNTNTIVIGEPYSSNKDMEYFGAAYVFYYNGCNWEQKAKLIASNKASYDEFGCSVAISDDGRQVIVGANGWYSGNVVNAGAAYIFNKRGTTWIEDIILVADKPKTNEFFGNILHIGNDSITIAGSDIYYYNQHGLKEKRGSIQLIRAMWRRWMDKISTTSLINEATTLVMPSEADNKRFQERMIAENKAKLNSWPEVPNGGKLGAPLIPSDVKLSHVDNSLPDAFTKEERAKYNAADNRVTGTTSTVIPSSPTFTGTFTYPNTKTLHNSDVSGAKVNVSDIKVVGNGDMFQLLCKASSEKEGWMKSTKAMQTPTGCLVQVTTQQRNPDGSYAVAEALTFVPRVTIVEDINGGRKLA